MYFLAVRPWPLCQELSEWEEEMYLDVVNPHDFDIESYDFVDIQGVRTGKFTTIYLESGTWHYVFFME